MKVRLPGLFVACCLVLFGEQGIAQQRDSNLDLSGFEEVREQFRLLVLPDASELEAAWRNLSRGERLAVQEELIGGLKADVDGWRELVANHQERLRQIQEQNARAGKLLAWAQYLELASQLIQFGVQLDAALDSAELRADGGPEHHAALDGEPTLELCNENQCVSVPLRELLNDVQRGNEAGSSPSDFQEVRDSLWELPL